MIPFPPIASALAERSAAEESAKEMRHQAVMSSAMNAARKRGLDVIHIKMTGGKITVTYNGKTNIPEVKRRK